MMVDNLTMLADQACAAAARGNMDEFVTRETQNGHAVLMQLVTEFHAIGDRHMLRKAIDLMLLAGGRTSGFLLAYDDGSCLVLDDATRELTAFHPPT